MDVYPGNNIWNKLHCDQCEGDDQIIWSNWDSIKSVSDFSSGNKASHQIPLGLLLLFCNCKGEGKLISRIHFDSFRDSTTLPPSSVVGNICPTPRQLSDLKKGPLSHQRGSSSSPFYFLTLKTFMKDLIKETPDVKAS